MLNSLGVGARIVAGGVLAAAAVGIALLAWGVTRTGRGGDSTGTVATVTAAWTVDRPDYGVASVMLFDLQTHHAVRLHMPSNVGFAEWLMPDATFVGYDVDGSSYNVYRIDGTKIRALFPQHLPLDHYISKSWDGRYALVSRPGGLDVLDAESGTAVQPLPGALDGAVSPDGTTLAYVTTNPLGALPGSAHAVSLMLARRDGSGPKFALPGHHIAMATTPANKYETFNLAYEPWSPDGRYLAVQYGGNNSLHQIEILDTAGAVVWAAPPSRTFLYATWAGPHRLFVVPISDQTTADTNANGTVVDATTGRATLASLTACCNFSPDGRYAIRVQSSPGIATQRCILVDTATGQALASFDSTVADRVANFCSTISWSADSHYALVSRRGG